MYKRELHFLHLKNITKYISSTGIFLLMVVYSGAAFEKETIDSLKTSPNSLIALPFVFFTPETKIALGVGSIFSFRSANNGLLTRPSNVKMAVTYTQRKQFILSFIPELFFKNEDFYYTGFYTFYKYPDKFWGIGNNTPDEAEENFTPDLLRTFTNIQKRLLPGLYAGIRYQYEYIHLLETKSDGVLQFGRIPGSEDGIASGAGFILTIDLRDNIYFPTRGMLYQIYTTFFNKTIGSDYNFNLVVVDLRHFFSIEKRHVIAFQTLNTAITGTPPFQMMSLLGGAYWMRGYFLGRYRDKNMFTMQSEYRFPIFWRFGGVAFAGSGDVAPEIKKFELNRFKYSLGFGIRFMFDTKEKINARLDFGFGEKGNSGFYATVTEAF